MHKPEGLSRQAFEPLPEGESYKPYVPASESLLEFTLKATLPGIAFGILFGAANAYLGLQAGLTISTSIPVAVMTVAAFRAMRGFGVRGTILEANQSQTIGSASSSVASGLIFTLPALFMWGMPPGLLQMTLLGLCGGLLGVLFMVPLRRFLIEKEHGKLPYPEGTACAEVLVASEVGGAKANNVFIGLGIGALFKFIFGWLKVLPGTVKFPVPGILKAELGLKMSAALFGVGYILGPKIGAVMVSGGLISALIIIPGIAYWGAGHTTPMFPETENLIRDMSAHDIWNRYVRYIGAGAVATAGLITLIRSIPTMIESFKIGLRQMRTRVGVGQKAGESAIVRTSHDLSLRTVGVGVLIVVILMAVVPQILGELPSTGIRIVAAILIAVFAFFFVTVASRIVGLVGVTSNPTSGMTIAALIGTSTVFLMLGWTDKTGMVAALTVGCVVAIAASIAGDTSQDLKTGFLLGATPRRQQVGELIGVLTSAVFVCMTILVLNEGYRDPDVAGSTGFGTTDLPAPQAVLMKLVIEGVLQQHLPWALVGIGAGLAILAAVIRIPSLPFAVGVYLPVTTMVPVFLGGLLRMAMERRSANDDDKAERRERGILLGSGLVGGEGLFGVVIAGVVYWQIKFLQKTGKTPLPGEFAKDWIERSLGVSAGTAVIFANVAALVVFAALVTYLARRIRRSE